MVSNHNASIIRLIQAEMGYVESPDVPVLVVANIAVVQYGSEIGFQMGYEKLV